MLRPSEASYYPFSFTSLLFEELIAPSAMCNRNLDAQLASRDDSPSPHRGDGAEVDRLRPHLISLIAVTTEEPTRLSQDLKFAGRPRRKPAFASLPPAGPRGPR